MLFTPALLVLCIQRDDARLVAHLAEWEKHQALVTNCRCEFVLRRTDPVFNRVNVYVGALKCLKPNLATLCLEPVMNPAEADDYVCDGNAVFATDVKSKTIVEFPLRVANLPFYNLLSGKWTVADVRKQFAVTLRKEDEHYIYLEGRPVTEKDQRNFDLIILALLGPKTQTPYRLAAVWLQRTNSDTERWDISKYEENIPGLDKTAFTVSIPPGFKVQSGHSLGNDPREDVAELPGPSDVDDILKGEQE